MQRILLSCVLLAAVFTTTAQVITSSEFSVSVSDPYQVIDASTKRSFSNGTDVLTVKLGGYKATIQKFSGENLDQASVSRDLELEKGFLFEELLQINGKVYLFYSVWDKPNATEQLFRREISFETGNFTGPGERLFGVPHKLTRITDPTSTLMNFSALAIPKFSFQQSNDQSHLAVRYRIKPDVKDDTKSYDVIGMYVYDKNVREVWHQEFTMPYTESKMDNLDFSVDKNGNGYFLAKVYNGDRPKEREAGNVPNYTIQLFKADATADLEIATIHVQEHFIDGIRLFEDPKGYMVCAGYYKKEIRQGVDGVFMAKLKPSGEVESLISHQIPLDVLNSYVSKRTQARNERREEKDEAFLDNLVLRRYQPLPDGSLLLIGEVHYIVRNSTSSGFGVGGVSTGNTSYTYYYKSVIVTKISPKGELVWMKKVPKDQSGTDTGQSGMSFKYISSKNYHYILFLDNVKNADLPIDRVPAKHSDGQGGYLTGYGLDDKTGEMKRISIFDTRDLNGIALFQFATNRIVSLNDKVFAVELYKKNKEDVMIKVELNEK